MTATKKQSITNDDFKAMHERSYTLISKDDVNLAIEFAVDEASRVIPKGCRCAYAWSGGKDSQALRLITDRLGIKECMIGLSELEFPAFTEWLKLHSPDGLKTMSNGWNMKWLEYNHSNMLFPSTGAGASKWGQGIQRNMQDKYTNKNKVDILLLGRRISDGNICGDNNGMSSNKIGGTRYNPIRCWSHEMVFAACHHYNLPLPPFYGWVRGYKVGTGPWAKRRVPTKDQGWDEVWSIDPDIVREAKEARFFPARRYMESRGLK